MPIVLLAACSWIAAEFSFEHLGGALDHPTRRLVERGDLLEDEFLLSGPGRR